MNLFQLAWIGVVADNTIFDAEYDICEIDSALIHISSGYVHPNLLRITINHKKYKTAETKYFYRISKLCASVPFWDCYRTISQWFVFGIIRGDTEQKMHLLSRMTKFALSIWIKRSLRFCADVLCLWATAMSWNYTRCICAISVFFRDVQKEKKTMCKERAECLYWATSFECKKCIQIQSYDLRIEKKFCVIHIKYLPILRPPPSLH